MFVFRIWEYNRYRQRKGGGTYRPEDSLLPSDAEEAKRILDGLTAFRRSCRRYQKKNVPGAVIQDMIERLANVPNGGNKQQVEYTLIDDMEQMDFFRRTVRREMERISGEGIYPEGFGKEAYEDMKRWEETVRPDMFFCGAPHVLIPHAPAGVGEAERDTVIAGTYFELLCASRGLGSVIMSVTSEGHRGKRRQRRYTGFTLINAAKILYSMIVY